MKVSFRVWILVICLALASMIILNGSTSSKLLAGFIVILVPIVLTYVNSKFGKVFVILILVASLAYVVLSATQEGVLVKSIEKNSTEFDAGLRAGMILKSINGEQILTIGDYSRVVSKILPSTEESKIILETSSGQLAFLTKDSLKITVEDIKMTNLKTGLDLSGGARALVSADRPLNDEEMNDLVSITNNRLNVFGISDISVRSVSDLEGSNFMLVEVAGISPSDLKEIVAKQGKFEARVGNESSANGTLGTMVFEGGKGDISDVCRNRAECSGVVGCQNNGNEYVCSFRFTIYLTEEAAKKHAEVTNSVPLDETGKYLTDKLYLYVDNAEVDSLLIGADLKGQVTTQVSIQGSGSGATQEEALTDAKTSMNKLQTILITGSLPYKLNLLKLDSVSPLLGKEFTNNIIKLALIVFAIVCSLILIRYRKIKITSAVILTIVSEAILTLAVAALIRWNLDAPSIAGIIAGMGTGVNDQIIIIDESVSGENTSLKERIKRALFIIFGAFFTIFAAMLPLFWAGTGLLRGFALTTLIGVTVGILITRPAFADIIKNISE